MSSNKKTFINVGCSIMVIAASIVVNFWLSPFIIKNIGVEANGFVSLANNFVIYAQLIVTALNSMSARYIAIEYVRKDYQKANIFYNSVFWGNIAVAIFLIFPAIIMIYKLEMIVNVSGDIIKDVKILFAFIFFNFFLTTVLPNWECGTYCTNRLERIYIPQMFSAIFRCVILFSLFTILSPRVYYVGIAATAITLFELIINCRNTHKLTPELKIYITPKKRIYSWKAIRDLVSAGVWNTVSNVGNMLLSGLDLIMCNMFIGAKEMGMLSLSKILPLYMQQLSNAIRNAFAPELTINYAKGDMEAVVRDINRAMKLTSVIMTIPIGIIVVLGKEFFSLWVPNQDAILLQKLSVLAILGYMFTSGTQILYNVFTTVNKVKENSIAMLISGGASIAVTIILIVFTEWDIYAVAGVSTACNLLRNMLFTLPATAKYLGYKWNCFLPQVGITVCSSTAIMIIGYIIKQFFVINSWSKFIIVGIVIGLIGILINFIIILDKEDKAMIYLKVKYKLCQSSTE